MNIILIIFFIGFAWYFLIIFIKGNPRFWNKVRKNPDIALKFFLENDSWLVDPPKNSQINSKEWDGPFRFAVPSINGKVVKIYGKVGKYEKNQEKLIKML